MNTLPVKATYIYLCYKVQCIIQEEEGKRAFFKPKKMVKGKKILRDVVNEYSIFCLRVNY